MLLPNDGGRPSWLRLPATMVGSGPGKLLPSEPHPWSWALV